MDIRIRDLEMVYKGGTRALADIDLAISNGMFGLLGPNGAGKTTLMRILVTLMEPTAGTVEVDGMDLARNRGAVRAMTGYLPQDFRFFPKIRTWEFLDYIAALAGLRDGRKRREAVDGMLHQVGLWEARDRFASKLSGGMKRRLGIAQALIGEPRIVVVDEPTTGLDPEERIRFRNLLSGLSGTDIVIVLSTHIVGDISSTCRDMALLDRGRVVYNGPPDGLVEKAKGHAWRVTAIDSELESLKERYPVISTVPAAGGWEVDIVTDGPPDGVQAEPVDPNLEHAYVYFMEFLTPQ